MTDGFPVPGEVFEGRYRISRLIGSGGFARVYYAVQEDLGRDVAIKVLMPASNSDGQHYSEKLVRRFNQEARLVSRLRDPHTITMYDYGETESGLLYMVFEYIEGRSLSEVVHKDGALAPDRVVKVLQATLSSLQEAHALGMLHRDIKPGNIMLFDYLGRPDQVKLLDFGIAKSLTDKVPGKDITADGALVGTPRYMSPEQIRGQEMGPGSDIYSLGLVAFEMLMGFKAIDSNSSVTIIGKQLDAAPFKLPQSADVPAGLRAIVDRMLAKDRETRYSTVEEVLSALQDYRDGKPIGGAIAAPEEDDPQQRLTVPMPEISVSAQDMTLSPATFAAAGAASIPPQFGTSSPNTNLTPSPTFQPDSSSEVSQEIGGSSASVKKLAVFGIVALFLIVGGVAAVAMIGGDSSEAGDRNGESLAATTEEPAEDGANEEAIVADLNFEVAERENPQNAPVAEDDDSPVEVMVATSPVPTMISVDGEDFGKAPVQVTLERGQFPVELIAQLNGKTVRHTLEKPASSTIIDVSEIVPSETEKQSAKTESSSAKRDTTRRQPRERPKRDTRPPKVSSPEPAKFEPKETDKSKESKGGLSLPALDTY